MRTITLIDTWMYAGTTYLPGQHDVSDDLAAVFESRKAFDAPADAAATTSVAAAPPAPDAALDLDVLVGTDAATSLRTAGYATPQAWATADDATLLNLEHVGRATLKKLRDAQG